MAKKQSGGSAVLDAPSILDVIKAGTASEQGFAWVNPTEVASLVSSGTVEINPTLKSDDGKVAARLVGGIVATSPAVVSAPKFELMTGLTPPERKRGGGGQKAETYPFSTMQVGQSFVIVATEKNPNPAKSFATTVSSATRRFSTASGATKKNRKGEDVPVLTPTKKFEIRSVKAGQTYPNGYTEPADGARIFRTA